MAFENKIRKLVLEHHDGTVPLDNRVHLMQMEFAQLLNEAEKIATNHKSDLEVYEFVSSILESLSHDILNQAKRHRLAAKSMREKKFLSETSGAALQRVIAFRRNSNSEGN